MEHSILPDAWHPSGSNSSGPSLGRRNILLPRSRSHPIGSPPIGYTRSLPPISASYHSIQWKFRYTAFLLLATHEPDPGLGDLLSGRKRQGSFRVPMSQPWCTRKNAIFISVSGRPVSSGGNRDFGSIHRRLKTAMPRPLPLSPSDIQNRWPTPK